MKRVAGAAFVTVVALVAGSSPASTAAAPAAATAAPVVLPPAKVEGVAPTRAGVARVLQPALRDPALGRHAGAVVYDADRRRTVYAGNAAGTFVPASTMKILTTTAALKALGPQRRFATRVVATGARSIVLVGGGDPLLASRRPTAGKPSYPRRATLPDLAAATAKALKAKGVRSVTLGYDASLFTGPGENHRWQPTYVSQSIVSPTSALWVDEGRAVPGMQKRSPDPALAAARLFAGQLKSVGIAVTAAPKAAKAPAGASSLALVRSPSLAAIVEHVNLVSDNEGAEVLLRHIGIGTRNGGSYAGGIKGVRSTLTGLGIDLGKARIEDGSGLSRTNAVPLQLLTATLGVAVAAGHPELRPILTGLPVAGFSGSLAKRFTGAGTSGGLGYARAKTGTLAGVHSLAGVVRDRTGTLLVFAAATDAAPTAKALAARTALDRAVAALAGCGCG